MKTLLELEPNDCRYTSDEHDFRFCAAQRHLYLFKGQMRRSAYCRDHHFLCTTISFEKQEAVA